MFYVLVLGSINQFSQMLSSQIMMWRFRQNFMPKVSSPFYLGKRVPFDDWDFERFWESESLLNITMNLRVTDPPPMIQPPPKK